MDSSPRKTAKSCDGIRLKVKGRTENNRGMNITGFSRTFGSEKNDIQL